MPEVDQTWEKKRTQDFLHSQDDFEAICKLPPLKDDKSLIESYELELGRIIRLYRNRLLRKDYVSTVRRCMKSADAAAQALEVFVRDFVELRDPYAMRLIMTAASIVNPRAFPENVGSFNPLFALGAIGMTMKDLKPAIKIATGISETQSRGRPFSAYTQAALELIFLWERILLDASPEPEPPLLAKNSKGGARSEKAGRTRQTKG
jgi:hypothetical protein